MRKLEVNNKCFEGQGSPGATANKHNQSRVAYCTDTTPPLTFPRSQTNLGWCLAAALTISLVNKTKQTLC